MSMGKIIYMTSTLALLNEESIADLMTKSTVKYLEESFYIIVNEPEE